ncbi:MAG: amidinotransferase [Bacteroidetes bacterium]|nr:amidinotransferase [Bacteroidota bacterium]
MKVFSRSMVAPLKHVLLKHASDAFRSQNHLDSVWRSFGYREAPDFLRACADYDTFIDRLESASVTRHFLPSDDRAGIDSIYVHDPAMTIGDGVLICRMEKKERSDEPSAVERFCRATDIPVLGRIIPPGLLEAGDILWLDKNLLVVGESYRSNREGIRQLRELAGERIDEIISFPLPHWDGPDDVLHLMSLISPIGIRSAVVYSRLLPVPFRRRLLDAGYDLLEVPDDEFETLGCNVLALSPSLALMADGNLETRRRIESRGIEVVTYPGAEISLKGHGGPTCLTRPLVRM